LLSPSPFRVRMEDIEQLLHDSSGEFIEISTSRPNAELPEWRRDVPEIVPVMPLRGVVLFPGTVAPLTVERAASLQLLEELLPTGRLLGLSTQRDADLDEPGADEVHAIGVLGNVLRMIRQGDTETLLLIQIVERLHFTEF